MERFRLTPGETVKMVLLPPPNPVNLYTHFLDKEKTIPVSRLEDLPCPVCDAGIECTTKYAVQGDISYQVRFPRSKKKRIRNKWAKQPRNFKKVSTQFYVSKEMKEAIDKAFGIQVHKAFGKMIQELDANERARYNTDPRPKGLLGRGGEIGVRTDYEASYDSSWERITPQPGDYTFVYSEDNLTVKLNATIAANICDAFIILCDDDMLLPEYVAKTVAKMEETGADIVYTESNNEPVTTLIRKSIWEKVGGFAEMGFFDWDFYWSCREAGALSVPLREHLFIYRQHDAQMAQHGRWKADGSWAKWEAAILAKHPKRGQP